MIQRSRRQPQIPCAPVHRTRRGDGGDRLVVAVGLTGGIGAGKSTALSFFKEMGATVASADDVVHGLYSKPELSAQVAAHFGPALLIADGSVDRRRLADTIRGNRFELRWLEELTHPLVAAEIERRVATAAPGSVVVCEVPLLFECGYERLFDLVVTVEADRETRRRRSTHDFGLEMFLELESLQSSTEQRVAGSDLSFFNDGDKERLKAFVRGTYERAQALLAERR